MAKYSLYFYKGKKILKTVAQGLEIGAWKFFRKEQMTKKDIITKTQHGLAKNKLFSFFNRF